MREMGVGGKWRSRLRLTRLRGRKVTLVGTVPVVVGGIRLKDMSLMRLS